ncbi:MAG: PASTA domain-containing protein, partial [Candidatus Hydrogenedens sp.]|nr:PASTA domain-containing protein [Candidatus Hydrogenedens sp.]
MVPGRQSMKRFLSAVFMAAVLVLFAPSMAFAKSSYQTSFTNAYPQADNSRIDSCLICHTNANPNVNSARNAYGTAWKNAGKSFAAIENQDSDGDGYANLTEINAFTFPGNAADKPADMATVPNVVGQSQAAAQTAITGAGLTVGTVTQQYSGTVAAGNVISQ